MSEAPATETRQRMPAALRRRQLLDVALEAFAAGGYHETSMEEIADAAGVTKPVLYQHFQSKQHLYLELLRTVGQSLLDEVEARVVSEPTPYQRVLAGFRAYFEFVAERTSAFQLVFGSGARISDEFADAVQSLEADLANVVARYIDAGIDDEQRELFGYAIVGLAEVTSRRWVAGQAGNGAPIGSRRPGDAEPGGGSPGADGGAVVPAHLDRAEADRLATGLADLMWAGLRALPGSEARRPTPA